MKIRSDYVSNSSSSSFMVVGAVFTYDDLVEMAKRHEVKSEYHPDATDYEVWDPYDIISALGQKFPELEFNSGIENYHDDYCIGIGYGGMKDGETKKDFEKRIKDQLKELTGKDEKVECLVDGGREC